MIRSGVVLYSQVWSNDARSFLGFRLAVEVALTKAHRCGINQFEGQEDRG